MSETRSPTHACRKRGRVQARKGCLKSPIPSPGPDSAQIRKCVAFGAEGTEEVYVADVWDRTPTEPARKLTYQDILELKEIQRSLPRANQLADPVSGRPGSHFLSAVPIGLLPLLSETDSGGSQDSSNATSPITSPVTSPPPTPTGLSSNPNWLAPAPRPQARAAPQPWHPPHLAHLLPSKPAAQREKPKFAFLPLLETPPSSEPVSPFTSNPSSRSPSPEPSDTDQSQDPPTPSLTNASLDSSPLSRASSSSPEPSYFQLPPLRGNSGHYNGKPHFGVHQDEESPSSPDEGYHFHHRTHSPSPSYALAPLRLGDMGMNPELDMRRHMRSTSNKGSALLGDATPIRRQRPRNVIEINGVEIDLDDDDEDDYDFPITSTPGASSSRNFPTLSSLSESLSDSAPTTAPGSPTTPPSCPTPPDEDVPSISSSFRPSTPTLASSPPTRALKSLHSPIRFQRNKGPRPGAI
ncbi:hypothetical protein BDZ94DRAFT_1312495 [Collybia nuda]|uniref:Uncharacterized protein n=1 Tax=Collybia nuda TaxID=64659 RepID=A0A9P6CFS5_9AGAR|nr:hypothetical protein BDZ94DRAFT_1312495 [Collybia nuda]